MTLMTWELFVSVAMCVWISTPSYHKCPKQSYLCDRPSRWCPARIVDSRDGQRRNLLEDLHGAHSRHFDTVALVFATATTNHVNRIARTWACLRCRKVLWSRGLDDTVTFEDEELVLVTAMLPPQAMGYEDPSGQVVSHVNGIRIRNLSHLLRVLLDAKESYVEFRFADRYAETLVFRRQEMTAALNDVLSDNGIRNACSPDLAADWSQLVSQSNAHVLSQR